MTHLKQIDFGKKNYEKELILKKKNSVEIEKKTKTKILDRIRYSTCGA